MQNRLTELLGIKYPIIQAPMAGGVTTSNLVASVSNSGGFGMIGAGYMTPEQIRRQIGEIRELTPNRFGINLFVPEEFKASEDAILTANQLLQPIKEELHLKHPQPSIPTAEKEWETFHEQVRVVIEEKVPVCSFTFGIPSKEIITEFKKHQILLIGTATTVEEALINEEAGMDAVVIQGSEAGGHRGSFAGDEKQIGLMSLITQVAARMNIPIIAAGGIMDGRGLMAAICLGAEGAQMGTAFLTCTESGAHQVHKEAILDSTDDQTVLTQVYSGKWARGIKNKFYQDMKDFEMELPEFPIQNALTSPIRKAASQQNNPEYMSLWAGQNASLARNVSANELIEMIVSEAEKAKKRIND